MYDKMFKNMYDAEEKQQAILSKLTLSDQGTILDPESLQQLDDVELLHRSTELRHMMHQQSSPTPRKGGPGKVGFSSVAAYQSK